MRHSGVSGTCFIYILYVGREGDNKPPFLYTILRAAVLLKKLYIPKCLISHICCPQGECSLLDDGILKQN